MKIYHSVSGIYLSSNTFLCIMETLTPGALHLSKHGGTIMDQLIIPENYHSALNLHDTQVGIKTVKDFFQKALSEQLNLLRVTAPLFVQPQSGLQ